MKSNLGGPESHHTPSGNHDREEIRDDELCGWFSKKQKRRNVK